MREIQSETVLLCFFERFVYLFLLIFRFFKKNVKDLPFSKNNDSFKNLIYIFRKISAFSFVFHEGNGVAQARPDPPPAGRPGSPTFYLGILDFPNFADSRVPLTHTRRGPGRKKTAGTPSGHSRERGEFDRKCVSPPKAPKVPEKDVKITDFNAPPPPPYSPVQGSTL